MIIEPEGGFEPAEAAKAHSAGITFAWLGGRTLRTETAAAFVLVCLVYELEM